MPPGRRNSLLLIVLGLCGCAAVPRTHSTSPNHSAQDVVPPPEAAHPSAGATDARSLDELNRHLTALQREGGWRRRGYLTPLEHDKLERLYAEYLRRRRYLMETVSSAENPGEAFRLPRAAALVRQCRAEQIDGDSLLVETFADDAIAVRKMNEAFYRSGIPRGTFDKLRWSVTHPDTIRYVQEVVRAAEDSGSPMRLVVASGIEGAAPGLHSAQRCLRAQRRIRHLLQRQHPVMPELANNMRHLPAAEGVVRSSRGIHLAWSSARSWTVARVGRIKNPARLPLQLTPVQKRQIRQAVQPGDVLLTFRAGFASNLFIPGRFKHAIIYIGTGEERRQAGLAIQPTCRKLQRNEKSPRGGASQATAVAQGDVVESLAEGVVFNNLSEILQERVNRMVVLRPVLGPHERRDALHSVLSFVGNAYDFHFDFTDASDQVCTELFYRSYNGKGNIQLPLTRRFGRVTLNADDIIHDYLSAPSHAFDLVLLVAPAPGVDEHLGRIWFGSRAHDPLATLMGH